MFDRPSRRGRKPGRCHECRAANRQPAPPSKLPTIAYKCCGEEFQQVRRLGQPLKRCADCVTPSRPPMVPHPDEVRARAVELRATGMTLREVSEKLGVPLGTIHSWTGADMTNAVVAARDKHIVAMAESGSQRPAISEVSGVSVATVVCASARWGNPASGPSGGCVTHLEGGGPMRLVKRAQTSWNRRQPDDREGKRLRVRACTACRCPLAPDGSTVWPAG